ncbi:hypothetical protein BJY52DRAFT_958961 [Lactarius psammicola]|nr:hypothetical protein BJY52DRAFT_958961 [Lactarius psammicola]
MPSITSRDPSEHTTPLVDNGSRPQTTPTKTPTLSGRVKQHIHDIIYDPKPTILQLFSWILTVQIFLISAIWFITTLPIRVTANIYEHWIRALFPKLPSIRKLLILLRSALLSILPNPDPEPAGPGANSSSAGSNPNRPQGANPLPTLNVDLDALRAGGN